MTGRILIAEATAEQRILLRAKLASAFYTVTTAESGAEALRLAAATPPDLVIAGSMLPDMCGTSFCTRLRALGGHRDTPLVLRSDEDRPEERLALLAVGADDVIARSDGEVLLARLRNLLSHARTCDEMRMRDDTQRALGLAEAPQGFSRPPKITLLPLTADPALDATAAQLRIALDAQLRTAEPARILAARAPASEAIILIDTGCGAGSGLALLSQLRMQRRGHPPCIVYVTGPGQPEITAKALDLGADDVMSGGLDPLELALRLPRLISRARRVQSHRKALRKGLRAAVTDPLTGLHNRRYALPHLARMLEQAQQQAEPLAILLADLDHFKSVNDLCGHPVGDQVLAATARTLARDLRSADLVARFGGEEFLIALPNTDAAQALATAEKLCRRVATQPLCAPQVTISIGLALSFGPDTAEDALKRADQALYRAKHAGRNQVHLGRPALARPTLQDAPRALRR
ncbi:diguanylate cyclase [Salipiger sp. PrR002]|uniref:diguanylate cyclase n=1 Tax=Salipiger sp. PrR002 TaxID=2706489 RepID=UPI0013B7D845|nr:diguanylate cyclase [Salipiger sp. PrR002]NDW01213.1 diguanylate cyclase [Salipiger sp. PrR002]NDW59793.1 diguanylate cyclase [Salipiger sp. PrR004]